MLRVLPDGYGPSSPSVLKSAPVTAISCIPQLWHRRSAPMDDAQRHLAQVERHIVEGRVHITQQRAIIQRMVEAGVSTELAKSMLETLEGNLHAFERHRKFVLSRVEPPTRPEADLRTQRGEVAHT